MQHHISSTKAQETVLVKKCHVCGQVIESHREVEKCPCCQKSFLPLHYFSKIHDVKTTDDFKNLFELSSTLCDADLIRGIHVLW